jgi:plasmid rolling circle replication initiator protein Rep
VKWIAKFTERQGDVMIYNLRDYDFVGIQVEELEMFDDLIKYI